MTNCEEIVSLLSGYLDRDLPPETCASIEAHLETCSRCGSAAESLRQTVGLCRQYRSVEHPSPLPANKHAEMRLAFEKVLAVMRGDKQG